MRNLMFLTGLVIARVLMTAVVLVLIYNPWLSLFQWIYPASHLGTAAYEAGWLFKAIAVLVVGGILLLFANTARRALGAFGMCFVIVVLGLIGFVPFYLGWLAEDAASVGDVVYFGALPVLLGLGLSTGYINRYLAGTLQTASLTEHRGHETSAHHHS